jgi:hypothetical protein
MVSLSTNFTQTCQSSNGGLDAVQEKLPELTFYDPLVEWIAKEQELLRRELDDAITLNTQMCNRVHFLKRNIGNNETIQWDYMVDCEPLAPV